MTDHPRIPLAGVIGSPIAHSLSPRLHGHWLKTYGIAGFYVPMDVAQADLREVISTLPKAGFVGVNVTIPPIAVDGPLLSIRKFSKKPLTMEGLIGHGSIAVKFLRRYILPTAGAKPAGTSATR